MMSLSLKQKIIGIIAVVGTILILIFQGGLYTKSTTNIEKLDVKTTDNQSENPEVVSTSPSPLEKAIIWGTTPIEVTFNVPIENIPELKYKLEPAANIKAELSSDRKTIKFTPIDPLPLGVEFTLSFPSEAKFDGKRTLGKDYLFHFKTIEYKGV